jgi:hypothetical protein
VKDLKSSEFSKIMGNNIKPVYFLLPRGYNWRGHCKCRNVLGNEGFKRIQRTCGVIDGTVIINEVQEVINGQHAKM